MRFLVYMYYTHPCYQTSIFDKNCAYYIQIFMVLIDHLRDLYLPTILARIADRSEPYIVHIFAHILQTWHVYRLYVLVFCIRWL